MTEISIPTSFGDIPLAYDDRGSGQAVVILHGGAGPASVSGFADLLAARAGVRVITPTHPGFGGTPRPDGLDSVDGLAELYAGLLATLGLEDATVIGNSIGGWITAELALRHPAELGRIVIVDGVGIRVDGHPVAVGLPFPELVQRSWFDPSKALVPDPATLPPAAREALAGNAAALALYAGDMQDAGLTARLAGVDVPALVVWGEADRVADVEYGRAFAAAIPGATFTLLERTGHVPQVETPELLLGAIAGFVAE